MDKNLSVLQSLGKEHIGELTENTCLVCVLTSKKNVYYFILEITPADPNDNMEKKAVQKLIECEDTVIESILCLFPHGQIEIPSYRLREAFIDLNAENLNADIYLQGCESIITKKLATTIYNT